jgi:hypothetical protein
MANPQNEDTVYLKSNLQELSCWPELFRADWAFLGTPY